MIFRLPTLDSRLSTHKDKRIISDSVKLQLEQPFRIQNGIAAGSVDLRHASQRIGVLNIRRVEITNKFTFSQYAAQVLSTFDLAWMGPQFVNSLVKSG